MIRSCLRELTRRNIAPAVLGITSIFLSGCGGLGPASKTPPPDPQLNQSINHIIFLVQENRGFDHYFGHLRTTGRRMAIRGAIRCRAGERFPIPHQMARARSPPITSAPLHAKHESGWNESHVDWIRTDPVSTTATLDGFVQEAAHFAQTRTGGDAPASISGFRADGLLHRRRSELLLLHGIIFANLGSWFSPLMSRTRANRLYRVAATRWPRQSARPSF